MFAEVKHDGKHTVFVKVKKKTTLFFRLLYIDHTSYFVDIIRFLLFEKVKRKEAHGVCEDGQIKARFRLLLQTTHHTTDITRFLLFEKVLRMSGLCYTF